MHIRSAFRYGTGDADAGRIVIMMDSGHSTISYSFVFTVADRRMTFICDDYRYFAE